MYVNSCWHFLICLTPHSLLAWASAKLLNKKCYTPRSTLLTWVLLQIHSIHEYEAKVMHVNEKSIKEMCTSGPFNILEIPNDPDNYSAFFWLAVLFSWYSMLAGEPLSIYFNCPCFDSFITNQFIYTTHWDTASYIWSCVSVCFVYPIDSLPHYV